MLYRKTVFSAAILSAATLVFSMSVASEYKPRPMTCEIAGTASLIKDYGNLPKGDALEVSMFVNISGKIGASYSEPITESGTMRVTHANGSSMESRVTHVNTWDRKTSKTSFMTRIFGPYVSGNLGGITGAAPERVGTGWRPGIEFLGETAGTEFDGRYPFSEEDWKLLNKRTLTLPDPGNENSITNAARIDEITVKCNNSD